MFRKGRNHYYGQKSPEDIYKQVSVTKCPTKISESQVSHSKDTSYTTIPKTFILLSQERKGSLLWTEVRTSRWNSLEKNYKERSNRSLKKFKKPRRKGSESTWPPQSTKLQPWRWMRIRHHRLRERKMLRWRLRTCKRNWTCFVWKCKKEKRERRG